MLLPILLAMAITGILRLMAARNSVMGFIFGSVIETLGYPVYAIVYNILNFFICLLAIRVANIYANRNVNKKLCYKAAFCTTVINYIAGWIIGMFWRIPNFNFIQFCLLVGIAAFLTIRFSEEKSANLPEAKLGAGKVGFSFGILFVMLLFLFEFNILQALLRELQIFIIILLIYCIYRTKKYKSNHQDKTHPVASVYIIIGLIGMLFFSSLLKYTGSYNVTEKKIVDITNVYNKDGTIKHRSDGSKVLKKEYGYETKNVKGTSWGMFLGAGVFALWPLGSFAVALNTLKKSDEIDISGKCIKT